MKAEDLRRAADPFFTTKGKRTGLGLPLLAQAAEQCGGRLTVVLGPGQGDERRRAIPLPPHRPAAAHEHGGDAGSPRPRPSGDRVPLSPHPRQADVPVLELPALAARAGRAAPSPDLIASVRNDARTRPAEDRKNVSGARRAAHKKRGLTRAKIVLLYMQLHHMMRNITVVGDPEQPATAGSAPRNRNPRSHTSRARSR